MIYAPGSTFEDNRKFYVDIKARAQACGRTIDHLAVLPGIRPIVGSTDAEAERKYRELVVLEPLDPALSDLSLCFNGHDFGHYDLDARFPDIEALVCDGEEGGAAQILAEVRAENLSLRQVLERLSAFRGPFVGSPWTIANELQRWFESRAADGFILFETLPGQLDLFVEHVIPILQARGLFREEYEGLTLRDSLCLPRPMNRYTAARATTAST